MVAPLIANNSSDIGACFNKNSFFWIITMRNLLILFTVLFLAGCAAGNFGAKRERLYEMNSDKEICAKTPERCINGVSR